MIPGLIWKSYDSQSIAEQGSKFRNEVSPEVSPEMQPGSASRFKFLLGRCSIQTTERYLGSELDIAVSVNDNLGL
jgi:hypothetical protein